MNHKSILTAIVIAFLLGGVEARIAIGRLEANVSAVEKRVQRIETDLDSRRNYAFAGE
jgi:hypothetical protein